MAMHDGHRQRVMTRFDREGMDHFSDIQVLEMLLFYCISRKDTNPIAHALLDRFGSLHQVLEAPQEELRKVPGMGEASARFLKVVMGTYRNYSMSLHAKANILASLEDCANYMRPFFMGKTVETVLLLCLDAKQNVLCCQEIEEGCVTHTNLSVRKVVELALRMGAATVVLAHNHPGGFALPSAEDIQTTIRIANALHAVDVHLADHFLYADNDCVSLRSSRGKYGLDIFD